MNQLKVTHKSISQKAYKGNEFTANSGKKILTILLGYLNLIDLVLAIAAKPIEIKGMVRNGKTAVLLGRVDNLLYSGVTKLNNLATPAANKVIVLLAFVCFLV
jgi:hypothetical protein